MKLLLPLILPWLVDHIDEAAELVIPALGERFGVDAGVVDLLVQTIPEVVDAARQVAEERPDLSSAEGAAIVVGEVRAVLDAADDLPVWADWTEAERDELLDAFVVVARAAFRVARDGAGTKDIRQGKRELRRLLRDRLPAALDARMGAT